MSDKPDKRMYFIRDDEALQTAESKFCVEFQVFADAEITGTAQYGPYELFQWEFGKARDKERLLCLRITAATETEQGLEQPSKKGYYHGGGSAHELVTLASLYLRRRLKLGPAVRRNDRPMIFSQELKPIDEQLISGSSKLSGFSKWLSQIEKLKPRLHQPFILATKLYQQALDLIEEKPDLAYLNLVSSIEVLLKSHRLRKPGFKEFDPVLSKLLDEVEDSNLREKIEKRILNKERFISRRFVDFILKHIDESFWDNENRPKLGRIEPSDLEKLLKRIYQQRSKTLHEGDPFPPTFFLPPLSNAELGLSLGMSSGGRRWERKDYVPYPHFFERLVHHVLNNFLKENATGKERL